MFRFAIAVLTGVLCMPSTAVVLGGDPAPAYSGLDPQMTLVPQTLLSLFHAPEVQKELRISESQFRSIQPQVQEIDGPWWRARIRKPEEQRGITADQEMLLVNLVQEHFGESSVNRLRQLELQAQGARCLIRPEIVSWLALSAKQVQDLTKIFVETEELAKKVNPRPGVEDADAKAAWQKAKAKELDRAAGVLSKEQHRKLMLAVGEPFDTVSLQRIYPLVPELIDSGSWIGKKVTLEELKGQVVLVHFYAFQCHNCIANFSIYNRWQKELVPKGVRIIGIQTPETPSERNFDSVAQAAKKDGFTFPVLVDLKSDNWNAWSNTMWPTVYVVDKNGFVRLWWQGELNWQGATGDKTIEELVTVLLNE